MWVGSSARQGLSDPTFILLPVSDFGVENRLRLEKRDLHRLAAMDATMDADMESKEDKKKMPKVAKVIDA